MRSASASHHSAYLARTRLSKQFGFARNLHAADDQLLQPGTRSETTLDALRKGEDWQNHKTRLAHRIAKIDRKDDATSYEAAIHQINCADYGVPRADAASLSRPSAATWPRAGHCRADALGGGAALREMGRRFVLEGAPDSASSRAREPPRENRRAQVGGPRHGEHD